MPPSAGQSKQLFPQKIPIWSIILILLLLGFAVFGDKGILRALQSQRHKEALLEEVQKVEAENVALKDEIKALHSDPRYIENIARRELGMVKDDELVYQFPAREDSKDPTPAEKNTEK